MVAFSALKKLALFLGNKRHEIALPNSKFEEFWFWQMAS